MKINFYYIKLSGPTNESTPKKSQDEPNNLIKKRKIDTSEKPPKSTTKTVKKINEKSKTIQQLISVRSSPRTPVKLSRYDPVHSKKGRKNLNYQEDRSKNLTPTNSEAYSSNDI
jgi:hypothetical protein